MFLTDSLVEGDAHFNAPSFIGVRVGDSLFMRRGDQRWAGNGHHYVRSANRFILLRTACTSTRSVANCFGLDYYVTIVQAAAACVCVRTGVRARLVFTQTAPPCYGWLNPIDSLSELYMRVRSAWVSSTTISRRTAAVAL